MDLVKLATLVWRDDEVPEGNKLYAKYLKELLDKFPKSIWADWAKFELINAQYPFLMEKYSSKPLKERDSLVFKELYNMVKDFIKINPKSYMIPNALEAVADWGMLAEGGQDGYGKVDVNIKKEAVGFYCKILKEYPEAEYFCAFARGRLRLLLGKNCEDVQGYSEEEDEKIKTFYLNNPEQMQNDKEFKEYIKEKRDGLFAKSKL